MRIYVFSEHYPTPYKPYIDTQLVYLLERGHDVRVFAEAQYTSTVHDEVRAWHLQERTAYYPATLMGLRRDGLRALSRLSVRRAARVGHAIRGLPAKQALLVATRALLLPDEVPDLCYIHNLLTASRLLFLKRIYPSTRVLMYFHGGEVGGARRLDREEDVFRSADVVATNTRFSFDQAVARGCPADRLGVVPVGFRLSAYPWPEPRNYRSDGRVRFISVGRMSPEKGFFVALDAVQRLIQGGNDLFSYSFVGTGLQYEAMRQAVRDRGLDTHVRFLGERTRSEVAQALAESDVLVLPSLLTDTWAETQATVVQEALLMGCLTITTKTGGVSESNAPDMARFAVPPDDAAALAGQMRAVLHLSADEMATLGRAGRAFGERYDIGPLMERLLALAAVPLPPA